MFVCLSVFAVVGLVDIFLGGVGVGGEGVFVQIVGMITAMSGVGGGG